MLGMSSGIVVANVVASCSQAILLVDGQFTVS